MKKQKTELKKLRIDKETLLPLGSHQIEGISQRECQFRRSGHLRHYDVYPRLSASLRHPFHTLLPRAAFPSGEGAGLRSQGTERRTNLTYRRASPETPGNGLPPLPPRPSEVARQLVPGSCPEMGEIGQVP